MRGLIIDEPWIGLILAGRKTWEMRKTSTSIRETIALIRKGSGAVVGVTALTGSLPALENAEAYANAERFHAIPPERQARAFEDGWRTPWVLANARPLAKPVAYEHPNGAVIWVNLSSTVVDAFKAQGGGAAAQGDTKAAAPEPPQSAARGEERQRSGSASVGVGRAEDSSRTDTVGGIAGDVCRVPITEGNIKNGHVYLRSVLSFFPEDIIGGTHKGEQARRSVVLKFKGGKTVETDIAGPDRDGKAAKYIFRARFGAFFEKSAAEPGDEVVFRRTSAYGYDVELHKRAV